MPDVLTSTDLVFALGVEDTFIPQNARGERSLDEYELTQHYERWREDLDNAAWAGARMLRWGIPWHRVNPDVGVWDFDWLDQVADHLGEAGLEPVWDLMHYGTPGWLHDEFRHPDYPERVAEYAHRIGERYGKRFPWFTPLNEPLLNALYCGRYGYWPPYGTGDDGFVEVLGAIAKGIVLSQEAFVEAAGDAASAMHVEAAIRYEGDGSADDELRFLRDQAFLPEDLVTGRVDGSHPLFSYLRRHGFADADFEWFQGRAVAPDVMGVNYYPAVSSDLVTAGGPDGGPRAPRSHPQAGTDGLVDVIRSFHDRYRRPVFLSETCHPGSHEQRLEWLDASVAAVRALRADGVDVRGYTWWSVIDMIEWDYRDTTKPVKEHILPMGLWDLVPAADGALERRRNPVADRFRDYATGRR